MSGRRATRQGVRIYPWSERANPKPTKFVSISGRVIDTRPPGGLEFWARLSGFIDNNPVQERDRFFMAMLKPLGIEKGKPFEPDERQRAILEDAGRLGDAMGRPMLFDGHLRIAGANAFPGTSWDWVTLVAPDQEADPMASSTSGCTTRTARSTRRRSSGRRCGPARPTCRPSTTRTASASTGQRLPPARARERARHCVLVADAVRHIDAFDDQEPEQRCGTLVV